MKPHELALSPTAQSAAGIHAWSKFMGEADFGELVKDLREQIKKVQGGDMGSVEAMLYGQAVTLETIFTNLARRAVSQEYLKQFQTHLGLALKAQAQCRATLEALAEIKNPRPVLIAKQANIAQQQQVNNGVNSAVNAETASSPSRVGAHAHAKQIIDAKNELLEAFHGNRLDSGAQGATSGAHQELETLGACDGATHV